VRQSEVALSVLHDAASLLTDPSQTALVFPGARTGRPHSNMALLMLLERMGRSDQTVHGVRSTVRDSAAETTSYLREVIVQKRCRLMCDLHHAACPGERHPYRLIRLRTTDPMSGRHIVLFDKVEES
jgi:hypothetical protein